MEEVTMKIINEDQKQNGSILCNLSFNLLKLITSYYKFFE